MAVSFKTHKSFVKQIQNYDIDNLPSIEVRFIMKRKGVKKKIDFPLCDIITNAHYNMLCEYIEKGWKIIKYKIKR